MPADTPVLFDEEAPMISIRLFYDTPSNASSQEHKTVLRILYWAAYLGKNDIVEKIIRMGYSPYLKSYQGHNAIMAAVDSGNLDTVQMILTFQYISTNPAFFEKSKSCKDIRGNNA